MDRCFDREIRAEASEVRTASAWLEHSAATGDVPSDQVFRLDLCLNEALANIIEHGGPQAQVAPVTLSLNIQSDAAVLVVTDGGAAFNPLEATPKAQPQSLDDAVPGGLGLGLMSSFADEVAYRYHQGRNCLSFTIRWASNP